MPDRVPLFRIAKAVGQWDVDSLAKKMPYCLMVEWTEYLNWELEQITTAIMSVLPRANSLSQAAPGNTMKLDKPEEISAFFDALNAK